MTVELPTPKQEWLAWKIHVLLNVPLPEKREKAAFRDFISANLNDRYREAYRKAMAAASSGRHCPRRRFGADFSYDGAQEDDFPGASGLGADWGW